MPPPFSPHIRPPPLKPSLPPINCPLLSHLHSFLSPQSGPKPHIHYPSLFTLSPFFFTTISSLLALSQCSPSPPNHKHKANPLYANLSKTKNFSLVPKVHPYISSVQKSYPAHPTLVPPRMTEIRPQNTPRWPRFAHNARFLPPQELSYPFISTHNPTEPFKCVPALLQTPLPLVFSLFPLSLPNKNCISTFLSLCFPTQAFLLRSICPPTASQTAPPKSLCRIYPCQLALYFGCGHIYRKAPFPVRSTVVKPVRDPESTIVGDHMGKWVAAIFFCPKKILFHRHTLFSAPKNPMILFPRLQLPSFRG